MNKTVKTSLFGSILEWYDFALIGSLAPIISSIFFPSEDELVSIIKLFFVFSIGFFARPIGAIYFGWFGDRNSRIDGLTRSLLVVSISTTLIGILPSYDDVGVLAPILLVVLRFIQGFGASGEHAGAITLIYESNNENRFLTSLSLVGIMLGMLLGFFMSSILYFYYTSEQLSSFAWRVPFIIGGVFGLLGVFYRSSIKLEHSEYKRPLCNPIPTLFRFYLDKLFLSVGIYWFSVVIFYATYFFIPSIVISSAGLDKSYISYLTLINMAIFILCLVFFCYMNKYFYAVFMMKSAIFLFFILGIPAFYFSLSGSYLFMFFGQLVLTIVNCLYLAPIALLFSEFFGKNVRYSGISISVNMSSAIFGGTTPALMLYISRYFDNPEYSISYFILASLFSLVCLIYSDRKNYFASESLAT